MSELLPPSSTPLERALADTVSKVSTLPTTARDLWNPDTCPVELLPWLAWAFSLDDWDVTWTESQQRAAVKASYSVHRYKGTIGSVKDALQALGLGVQVQEWFNQIPAGDPYTYKLLLEVNQYGVSLAQLETIQAVVENAKNLRSHMTTLDLTVASNATVYIGAVAMSGNEIAFSHPAGTLIADGTYIANGSQIASGLITYGA
ncbi:phage tail protein I [Aeromonas caviae]